MNTRKKLEHIILILNAILRDLPEDKEPPEKVVNEDEVFNKLRECKPYE